MSELPQRNPTSIRDKNKERMRSRIIDAASVLVEERGLSAVSADDIAAHAEVGRATFFRYFDSKEAAVVVGFFEKNLLTLVQEIQAAPAGLGPMDAILFAFRKREKPPKEQTQWVLLQARLGNESPTLKAKAMEYQARYEGAIADAISIRYRKLAADDIRPRLLAASALAIFRTCNDHWSATGAKADLPKMMRDGLKQLSAGFEGHS